MLPIYATDLFGARSFDKILGIFVSVNTAGYALGAPVINACYDITGSYKVAFVASLVILAFIVALLQIVLSSAARARRAVLSAIEAEDTEQSAEVDAAPANG